jgi:pyrimidine operon attenuation protein/uracil phosphoribosyltransferase
MEPQTLARTTTRIAYQILERNPDIDNLAIIGIRTRGVNVAQRIVDEIEKIEGNAPNFGVLDITLYRDDFKSINAQPIVQSTELDFDIEGMNIVLLDDVLYTGRTIRAALDELVDFGRPASIQLGVLIDRGWREYPIRADYVGREVSTSREQEVLVHFEEIDGKTEIILKDKKE